MAGVKRSVDVEINVKGNSSQFTSIIDGFASIKKAVDTLKESIDVVDSTLKKFTDSSASIVKLSNALKDVAAIEKSEGLKDTVSQLIKLSKLEKFPVLGTITGHLQSLTKLKSPTNFSEMINSLKGLSALKQPADLTKFTDTLTLLSKVGTLPNLDNIAKGFQKFTKIETPKNLDKFVTEVKKFQNIKVPNIKQIAEGLERLISTSLDMNDVGRRLRVLYRNMKNFVDLKIPSISSFVAGLRELIKINTQTSVSQLSALSSALALFKDLKVPNFASIATNIRELSKVDTQRTVSQLYSLSSALKSFSTVKLPSLSTITTGLRELLKIDTQRSVSQLNALSSALVNFKVGSLTGIKSLTDGLAGLLKINTQSSVSQLNALSSSLKNFPSKLNLGWMNSFATGLRELLKVNTQSSISQLTGLSSAIRQFSGQRLPNFSALVKGLNDLIALNIGNVISKIRNLSIAIVALNQTGQIQVFANFANNLNSINQNLVNVSNATAGASRQMASLGNTTATLGERFRTFGERIKNYFSYRIVADFTMQFKNALTGAIEAIGQYDQALKDLQAITGATGVEVVRMGDTIKEVASKTKFSAKEVAEGMRTLGQAGLTAGESIEAIQYVSNLATGTLSDMSTTVDLVTTALRVFKLEASNSQKVTDVFANAANRSKLTIDKLRTALNYVGPIAQSAGISLEDMSASMMTLANSGLRASTIGTGLRRVFAELVDPSEKLSTAARNAGVSLSELDPQTNSLSTVISNLGLVISDTSIAFDIFGKRGAAAALSLTGSQGQFEQMVGIVHRTGTAAEMAETQMEGLGVSFKNLKDKLGNLAIAFGEGGFIQAFKLLIDGARSVVDIFTALTSSVFGKFIIQTGIVTAGIIALASSLGLVTFAFRTLRSVQLVGWLAEISSGIAQATYRLGLFGGAANLVSASTTGMATAARAAAVSFGALWTALWPILTVAAVFTGIALAIKGVVSAVDNLTNSAQKSSDASRNLAEEYQSVIKSIDNYESSMVGLAKNSKEAQENNKNIRKSLLEVATGTSALSDEALLAVSSISAMTGELLDGGKALTAFRVEADRLKNIELAKTFSEGFRALEQQTGAVQGMKNFFSDLVTNAKLTAKGVTESFKDMNLEKAITLAVGLGTGNPFTPLVLGAQTAKEEIKANLIASASASEFADALNEGKASWEDYTAYVKILMQKLPSELTSGEKVLIEQFQKRSSDAIAVIEQLGKAGINAADNTADQMMSAAESMGLLTGASDQAKNALRSIIQTSQGLEGSFSNWIEKWKQGNNEVELSIADIKKTVTDAGGTFTNEHAKRIEEARNESAEYKKNQEKIIASYDAIKKAKADAMASATTQEARIEISKEYIPKLQAVEQEANQLHADYIAKNGANDDKALTDLITKHRIANEKIAIQYRDNSDEMVKAKLAENKKFASAYKELIGEIINPKEILKNAKLVLEIIESSHKKTLYAISVEEATGKKTHEEAEQAKLEASLAYHDARLLKAKSTFEELKAMENPDDSQIKKALALVEQEEQAKLNIRLKAMQKYGAELRKADENIKKQLSKRQEEVAKSEDKIVSITAKAEEQRTTEVYNYTKKRTSLETNLASKIESINKRLSEKLKTLSEKRLEAERKSTNVIAGLSTSLEDKLLAIRQRGMSDVEKDTSNRQAAFRKLTEGNLLLERAKKTGDEASLERGKQLLTQASGLYEGLKSSQKAESGVRSVIDALKKAEKIALDINLKNIDKDKEEAEKLAANDIKKATELHNTKIDLLEKEHEKALNDITTKLNTSLSAEEKRHKKVMGNIDKEILKFKNEMTQAKNLLEGVEKINVTPVATSQEGDKITEQPEDSEEKLDSVKDKANESKKSIDEIAKSLNIVRMEAESDIELQLRIKNTDEVTKLINDMKNEQKVAPVDIPIEVPQSDDVISKINAVRKTYLELFQKDSKSDAFSTFAEDSNEAKNAIQEMSDIFDESIGNASGLQALQDKVTYINALKESGQDTTLAFANLSKDLNSLSSGIELNINADQSISLVDTVGERLTNLKSDMQSNPIKIGAELGASAIETIRSLGEINGLVSTIKENTRDNVNIQAEVTGTDEVNNLGTAIDSLENKTVVVTTEFRTKGSPGSAPAVQQTETQQFSLGGLVQKFADGGAVFKRLATSLVTSGTGLIDDVPAMLKHGEFVHVPEAVKYYGVSFMNALNRLAIPKPMLFNNGGLSVSNLGSNISSIAKDFNIDYDKLFSGNGKGSEATPGSVSNWSVHIGKGAFSPRGKVQSLASNLMDEVRRKY